MGWLSKIFGCVGLAAWLFNFGLVLSWIGSRPREPDPEKGFVHPYNNHGIVYVTQGDLIATHMLMAIGLVSIAVSAVLYLRSKGSRGVGERDV